MSHLNVTTTTTTTTTATVETAEEPAFAPPSLVPLVDTSTPQPERTFRLSAGFGPALGFDTKDKCGEGECGALHVQIGGPMSSRLWLLAGASVMAGEHVVHHVEVVSLQFWPTTRLWGELGVGVGSKRSWVYNVPPEMDLSGVDPAGTAAIGYEVVTGDRYSIGLQARVASTIDLEHTSFGQLLVGVSLY